MAFCSGNLWAVSHALKEQDPARPVIICGDDDYATERKSQTGDNPGRKAANMCVSSGAADAAIFPPFNHDDPVDCKLSDWNDFYVAYGRDVTVARLNNALNDALANKTEKEDGGSNTTAQKLAELCHPLDREVKVKHMELIAGMFPRGYVSAIVAAAGTGKTWFIMRLASDLSNGGPIFGGFTSSEPCKTLILAGEAGYNIVIERLQSTPWRPNGSFAQVIDLNESMEKGFSLDFSTAKGRENLKALIDQMRPEVVFVDSLFSFANVDENKSASLNPLFQFFISVAKEKDIALVVIHHTRKRKAIERKLPLDQDDAIGSSILNRSVAQLIGLQSVAQLQGTISDEDMPPCLVRPLKSWCRFFKKFTFQVVNVPDGTTDMVVDLSPETLGKMGTKDRVLEYVYENFEPGVEFKASDLSKIGIAVSTLRGALSGLVEQGELGKRGDYKGARYFIPSPEQPTGEQENGE